MTTILHILQHALGRDEYGKRKPNVAEDYRNHFCIGEGCEDWALCEQAVFDGLMVKHPPSAISGGDWVFVVTAKGKTYVEEHSPAPPKVSRSKSRYLQWLRFDASLTFGEWLKGRYYERA